MKSYPEESVLVNAAESVWSGTGSQINIQIEVSEKLISRMREYLPGTLSLAFITDSDIRHIKKKHGQLEESRGQVTITPKDFACIPAVLNEYDSCECVGTDKLGNKKFVIRKDIEGCIYLVTAQKGKRKLEIKTMWKKNRSGASC